MGLSRQCGAVLARQGGPTEVGSGVQNNDGGLLSLGWGTINTGTGLTSFGDQARAKVRASHVRLVFG